jgi:hypothetical protein
MEDKNILIIKWHRILGRLFMFLLTQSPWGAMTGNFFGSSRKRKSEYSDYLEVPEPSYKKSNRSIKSTDSDNGYDSFTSSKSNSSNPSHRKARGLYRDSTGQLYTITSNINQKGYGAESKIGLVGYKGVVTGDERKNVEVWKPVIFPPTNETCRLINIQKSLHSEKSTARSYPYTEFFIHANDSSELINMRRETNPKVGQQSDITINRNGKIIHLHPMNPTPMKFSLKGQQEYNFVITQEIKSENSPEGSKYYLVASKNGEEHRCYADSKTKRELTRDPQGAKGQGEGPYTFQLAKNWVVELTRGKFKGFPILKVANTETKKTKYHP